MNNKQVEQKSNDYAKGFLGDYDPEYQEEFDAISAHFLAGASLMISNLREAVIKSFVEGHESKHSTPDKSYVDGIISILNPAPTYEQIEAALKDRSVYNEANDYENATPSEGVGSGIFLSGVLRALSIIRALYGKKEGENG